MSKIKEKKKDKTLIKREIIRYKESYVSNTIKGKYFLERCNMIADQVKKNKILECVDGAPKPKAYILAEFDMFKRSAITSFREAEHSKKQLINLGWKDEDFEKLIDYYFNQKIIREDYGDEVEDFEEGFIQE
jgi:hypothetical protein